MSNILMDVLMDLSLESAGDSPSSHHPDLALHPSIGKEHGCRHQVSSTGPSVPGFFPKCPHSGTRASTFTSRARASRCPTCPYSADISHILVPVSWGCRFYSKRQHQHQNQLKRLTVCSFPTFSVPAFPTQLFLFPASPATPKEWFPSRPRYQVSL